MSNDDRILRLPDVMQKVGLKKSAIYKLIKAGDFPTQIKLGKHASGWLESAINAWIMKKAGVVPANDAQMQQAA